MRPLVPLIAVLCAACLPEAPAPAQAEGGEGAVPAVRLVEAESMAPLLPPGTDLTVVDVAVVPAARVEGVSSRGEALAALFAFCGRAVSYDGPDWRDPETGEWVLWTQCGG